MTASSSTTRSPRAAALWLASRRGARFGAKFTFWLLVALVTAPLSVVFFLRLAGHPSTVMNFVAISNLLQFFVVPAVVVPVSGAVLGAAVAAVLFPVASLFSGSSTAGRWESYEQPASPFGDLPATARSREELLRRIVLDSPRNRP